MEKLIFNLCLPNEAFVDNWHQVDTKTIQMTSLYSTMLVTLKIIRQYKVEWLFVTLCLFFRPIMDAFFVNGQALSKSEAWIIQRIHSQDIICLLSKVQHTKLDLKQQDWIFNQQTSTRGHNWFHLCVEVCNMFHYCRQKCIQGPVIQPKLTIASSYISPVPGGVRPNISWQIMSHECLYGQGYSRKSRGQ